MLNNKWTKRFINITLVLLIVFLYTKVDNSIMPVIEIIGMLISPIIIGAFIYYGLRPIVKFLGGKFGHKGIFAFLTIIAFLAVFTVIIIFGGSAVKTQFEDAFVLNQDKLTEYKDFLDEKIQEIAPDLNIFSTIYDNLQKYITTIGKSLGNNALGLFSSIGNIGTQTIIVFFVLFYLLKEDRKFLETLNEKLPEKNKDEIIKMEKRIDDILSTYISGQLLAALVIGTLMFIGYLIIGMPNALLMGAFSLVLAVIPFLGAFLGVLPAILIALTIEFSMVVKIVVLAVVVQQLEGNLITPNIMGSKLKLHPLGVIFIVIISVNLMGILGAFIGIPLYLVLVAIGKTIYRISKKSELEEGKKQLKERFMTGYRWIINLIMPLIIIIYGYLYKNVASKKPSYFFGYKTQKTLLSKETWEYANKRVGEMWMKLGLIYALIVIAIIALFPSQRNKLSIVVIILALIVSMIPFPTVQRELNEKFDKKGKRK